MQTVSAAGRTVVNVYNGSDRRGLAGAVARELQRREFRVLSIGNDASDRHSTAVSIRYGAGDEIPARTVALQFPGRVKLVPDPRARDDHAVDVVIGSRYKAMTGRTAAAAAIAPAPTPRGCLRATTAPSLTPGEG
ncbi:LytR C-terminal domain-containing protein [Kineosporia sp. J2-2]|uniref:LytR C-terminal domain-containing protein n=1 Tax=Kineosporia corallincola TaxID=2835133 RepID=A0ABS5T8E2_9ACTN|nr:LytR C-terminal domain-containing protein [Kineosporia corallincola]MBT0767310.1 LytR C-terminal domain-containing protein [Kineosporia corallincola]